MFAVIGVYLGQSQGANLNKFGTLAS